ncbi:MAG: hypothetical protein J5I65_06685 [Aridibacter famidurans]|nr:hypothetical protein [Aridibacter famidurans]
MSSRRYSSKRSRIGGPFWLPAFSYYVLTGAVSAMVFFVIWGILYEGGEDAPWITAGVAGSVMVVAAVVVREIVLRNARRRYLSAQNRLDRNLTRFSRSRSRSVGRKLSIAENELMLAHIARKADAADTLGSLVEGHREVFVLCDDYLELTARELSRTDINSPRFVAMRKGRKTVRRLHRRHLLDWTELESRSILERAKRESSSEARAVAAASALEIVEEAIGHYPGEQKLLESAEVLREFISTARIAGLVEEAESSEKSGDYEKAFSLYENILARIRGEDISEEEQSLLSERITEKLEEIRQKRP